MNKLLLTICIPTYNRPQITAKLITTLPYQKEIEYIIIDDGSKEEDYSQLENFIAKNKYPVRLLRKKNGGKLAAIRYILPYASGQFFMDLDSDDGFTKDYLENILQALKEVQSRRKKGENIIGTTGLCSDINNEIIGDNFSSSPYVTNFLKMRLDNKIKGDKEEIILTAILKQLNIPEYPKENRIPTSVQWFSLGAKKCLFVNKVFSQKNIHDTERITDNILAKIVQNANGTRLHFKTMIQYKSNYKSHYYFFKAIIQYLRFSLHGATPFIEKEIGQKYILVLILFSPISFLGYIWDYLRLFRLKHLELDGILVKKCPLLRK